ncbi:MAG: hypothetical protein NVS3B3_23430 [Aquirhabdus sp.]
MKRSQYRQLQVGVFALTVLFGATACNKHKPEASKVEVSAPEQTSTPEVKAIKQSEADKHSADYYKSDNKQRVAEENNLLDDVSSKK